MAADPPLCLDLTRLARRVGQGPLTGIDRVELAWAQHLLSLSTPVFGLMRSSLGFLLLDKAAIARLVSWTEGAPVPATRDPLALLRRWRGTGPSRRAEAALSQIALARTHRLGLAGLLRRHLPEGTLYLNTGHSNLHERSLKAVRHVPAARVAVLVHDTIPLDLPGSQRPGVPDAFLCKLRCISAHADQVWYVSADSQHRAEQHFARIGRVPPGGVAPIAITPPTPDPAALPPGLPPKGCYFVALGTIEPRKDHALLLDIWEQLASQLTPVPRLLIIGRRGWQNHAVFQRLDQLKSRPEAGVDELPGLSDGAVAALLQGARALLMPSRAEGYGLPLLEAMALGTPVLATDLPVYKETVQDYAVYLPAGDRYSWHETVMAMTRDPLLHRTLPRSLPRWQDHFSRIKG